MPPLNEPISDSVDEVLTDRRSTHVLASSSSGPPPQPAAVEVSGDVGDRHVLAHAHRRDRAAHGALGGHEGDPDTDRLPRSVVGDLGAVEHDVAVVAGDLPGEQRQHVLAPRARDAGEPDDLAGVDVEVDPVHVATAQAADREHRSTDFGRLAVGGDLDVVTDDQLDEAHVIELGDGHRRHQLPVAQHRDTIGELEHLVEVVRDVDDRHAPLLQAVDDLEQSMDVVARQRGRRLVEHEQVGSLLPTDESAGDRHGGALRRRQIVDRCLDVDVARAPAP